MRLNFKLILYIIGLLLIFNGSAMILTAIVSLIFNDGVVKVELRGSCSGCPSSVMTLKQGVQNLLCHYVKEVKSVEAN